MVETVLIQLELLLMTALLIDLDVILDIEEIVLEIVDLLTQDSETGEDNTSD